QILAVHSPVLNAMFYGNFNEKNKKEIELKGVDRGVHKKIKDLFIKKLAQRANDNVRFLLNLGDRFEIKIPLDLCDDYLMSSTSLTPSPKLLLSEQYRLVKLQ
ncbi:hypothetical protein PENTCL1PPCAC_23842, partial [Pristionchus entomophagus]